MSRFFTISILLVLSLSGFTSCTLLKHATSKKHKIGSLATNGPKPDSSKNGHTFIGPLKDTLAEHLARKDSIPAPVISNEKKILIEHIKAVWQKPNNYSTFSCKAKMHYEEGDNQKEFTTHIRIRKDSVIWVNITALGGALQIARILVTADSLKMINSIDREVLMMPISQATKLLPAPVDFSILQNFIVGQALKNTGVVTDASDFGGTLTLQSEDSDYIQQIAYNKLDSTMRSYQMGTHSPNGPTGMIEYGNYADIQDKKFAYSRSLHLQNAGIMYILGMDFSNVNFDAAIDFPFSVPQNYTVNPRK